MRWLNSDTKGQFNFVILSWQFNVQNCTKLTEYHSSAVIFSDWNLHFDFSYQDKSSGDQNEVLVLKDEHYQNHFMVLYLLCF